MRAARLAAVGAAALGGSWAAACATLYWRAFAARRWGLEADRGWTPDDLAAPSRPVSLRARDGVDVGGWYLPGTRPAGVVVSGGYRGRAGDVLGVATALQRAGFHVLVYGWRGTPGSGVAAHTLGVHERQDLEAAIDGLEACAGRVPIGLLGISLGGAVSIVVGADDLRVRAVCTDSAFCDPTDVLGDGVRRVMRMPSGVLTRPVAALLARRTGAQLREFRPLDSVGRLAPRPLLLIHGGADLQVHPRHSERLLAFAQEPKQLWMLDGVAHVGAYFADREAYVRRVAAFFAESLGTISAPTH
jgi:dipeptidyl aminopeptidase/acylaminoacyl peptidase